MKTYRLLSVCDLCVLTRLAVTRWALIMMFGDEGKKIKIKKNKKK
jgi:hypothetical protein